MQDVPLLSTWKLAEIPAEQHRQLCDDSVVVLVLMFVTLPNFFKVLFIYFYLIIYYFHLFIIFFSFTTCLTLHFNSTPLLTKYSPNLQAPQQPFQIQALKGEWFPFDRGQG